MKKRFHSDVLERLSERIGDWSSSSIGFACASLTIILWLIAGPIMHYSEKWQLIINSVTTTITFLMVFLIQRTEHKDAQALHAKLDAIMEILGVNNKLMDLEHWPERKLDELEQRNQDKANQV